MSTRTYEDFHKWLGDKPERLGIVSNLYKQYTATSLTEALMNVYTMEKGKPSKFQSLNSFLLEWEIDVNFVKRIPILAVEGDGSNGSEVIFHFPERYYEMYDVFVIEETRQQCMVMLSPVRRSNAVVEYVCRVIDRKLSRGHIFLITNGGLHHHLSASGNFGQLIRKNFPVIIGNRMIASRETELVNVVGPLCTPLDILADKMHLPKAEIGDYVVVFQSGAYGLTASPIHFLSHPVAREVLV